MKLSELVGEFVGGAGVAGGPDPGITGITEDSRLVGPGYLFVAVPGTRIDGHDFVIDAVTRGAAAVIAEKQIDHSTNVPTILVPSSRVALAHLAARFNGHPARKLRMIGFTGTFGKTTTSEVLRALLAAGGRSVAVLGSLGARYDGYVNAGSGLTTPAPVELHRMLCDLRTRGADTVIMEVTSHAMMLDRVEGIAFSDFVLAAILPGEHTDFHRTYADYVAAKARFLNYMSPDGVVAYDADNAAARELAHRALVGIRAGVSLGARHMTGSHDVEVRDVELDEKGALMTVHGERLRSALLGSVNVRSVGLALAHALARDIDLSIAREALATLVPPRRRMQRSVISGRTVLDDVAAHPDNFRATFEVVDLLPREHLVVAYAMRGNRGVDINRRNALALADLALLNGASRVVVTSSNDVVGESDFASAEEIDAMQTAFAERGCAVVFHDTLAGGMQDVARATWPGDLVVLVGAQGMDKGAQMLGAVLGS